MTYDCDDCLMAALGAVSTWPFYRGDCRGCFARSLAAIKLVPVPAATSEPSPTPAGQGLELSSEPGNGVPGHPTPSLPVPTVTEPPG